MFPPNVSGDRGGSGRAASTGVTGRRRAERIQNSRISRCQPPHTGVCCAADMPNDAESWVQSLGLAPHPEGGFYAETFRSDLGLAVHGGRRAASTAIYFLLRAQDFSAFHRVRSDEVWHHYAGDALELILLDAQGALRRLTLGSDLAHGERPQAVAPRDVLQAARVLPGGRDGFALCGCTVAPGFEFADFELPERSRLQAQFPEHAALFETFCR
jgi:predicted cupin superfamily sugar epimerase